MATAFVIALLLINLGTRSLGGVLGATGSPAAVARATASASVAASTSVLAIASPSASPVASVMPSPTTRPTPRPTARPTPPPQTATERPTTAVANFYDAVERHDWDRAIARWSASMQRRYPPDEWLIGRFARTTRIDLTTLRQVRIDPAAGTATVAVSVTEYRTVEPSPRSFTGTWDLVFVNGRWLLNDPHF